MMKRHVVAESHGIKLVSISNHPQFVPVISLAIDLICECDPRRMTRVQAQVLWIFDHAHWGGAGCGSYLPRIKACRLDFEPLPEYSEAMLAADYACLIIHEATHGVLHTRRIEADGESIERVERLCYAEQNRFLRRLVSVHPQFAAVPFASYDPAFYSKGNYTTKLRRLVEEARRGAQKNANSGALPDGGPGAPLDGSNVVGDRHR